MSLTRTSQSLIATGLSLMMLMMTGGSSAQDSPAVNSLADGKTAMLFEVNGDFDLSSFEGTTLSIKRHYTNNRAYRIGLSVRAGSQSDQSEINGLTQTSYDEDNAGITVGLTKLYHHSVARPVTLFYGVGPRLSYDRSRGEAHQYVISQRSEIARDEWGAGIGVLLGVEWFVRPSISLMAEYGSQFGYHTTESTTHSGADSLRVLQVTQSSEADRWELKPDPVRFGISLYW